LVAFLEQLRRTWPEEKPVVVPDKVGSHKSRQTLAWWQQWQDPRCPLFLPADTPELNLRERVWRYGKERRSRHRWWADWQALWEATAALLPHVKACFHQAEGPRIDRVQNFCASA
jgi:DDE superfamily endonuclease